MKKFLIFLCPILLVFGMVGVAAADPIPVANSTFNDPGTFPVGFFPGPPTSWGNLGDVGVFNPGFWDGTSYGGVYDGSDVALLYSDGGTLGQWLAPSLADGMTYTLSVQAAGRIGYTGTGVTYTLCFVAGDPGNPLNWVPLGTSGTFTPTEGAFNTTQFAYTYTASNYDPIYSVLGINLVVSGASDNNQVLFDNVSLDGSTAAAVPEPATMFLLGSGLIGLAGFARRRFKK